MIWEPGQESKTKVFIPGKYIKSNVSKHGQHNKTNIFIPPHFNNINVSIVGQDARTKKYQARIRSQEIPGRLHLLLARILALTDAESPYIYLSPYLRLSWFDARKYCKKLGGDLASIHNMVEHLKIIQQITWDEKSWNGGYRQWNGNKQVWTWSDATLFDYPLADIELWYKCMTMSIDDIFQSVNCQAQHYFVCKIDTSGTSVKFKDISNGYLIDRLRN